VTGNGITSVRGLAVFSLKGTNPDFPLDKPLVELNGKLLRESDGNLVPVTLVPMGAQSARPRRVTFPAVAGGKK
jgi:hypothetical protein